MLQMDIKSVLTAASLPRVPNSVVLSGRLNGRYRGINCYGGVTAIMLVPVGLFYRALYVYLRLIV